MKTYRLTIELDAVEDNAIPQDFVEQVENVAKQLQDGYNAGQYFELEAVFSSKP